MGMKIFPYLIMHFTAIFIVGVLGCEYLLDG